MPRFIVTITQTETRSYHLDADTLDAAEEMAGAWNEERTGDKPDGAAQYIYTFDSTTETIEV